MAQRLAPLLLIAAYIAAGNAYAAATPPFEASDEVFHYPFVRHLALGRGLPVQKVEVRQLWEQVGSHPPAYYALSAALTFWIDTSDFDALRQPNPFARIGIPGTPHNVNYTRAAAVWVLAPHAWQGTALAIGLLRGASLVMGAGTVAMTYLLARVLGGAFPGSGPGRGGGLPLLAAGLVAFNPMFLFVSASVNNDNLIWLLSAVTLFLLVHLVRGPSQFIGREIGERPWDMPALGALLGLAALTKVSGLVLVPMAGLALAAQAVRIGRPDDRRGWRRLLAHGTIVAAMGLLIAGWWYVRNLILYEDALGLAIQAAINGPRREPFTLATLIAEFPGFWYSYWGVFGAFNVLAAPWAYGFFALLTLAGAAGGLWWLARWSRELRADRWLGAAHGLLALFVALTAGGLIRWNMLTYAAQGRLMFTALGPLSIYLGAGLLAWIPHGQRRRAAGLLIGILGAVAVATAARDVAGAYRPPAAISERQIPADALPVNGRLAPGAELIGYRLESPRRLSAGDTLVVTLYWRATAPMTADHNLFLHVLGRGRELVGSADTWPGGGLRPTSLWQTGDIYPDTYAIPLRADALTPSRLWLDLAMWDVDPAERLAITDGLGNRLPSLTVPAGLLERAEPMIVQTPLAATGSTLEGGFALLGYDLPGQIAAGTPATIVLHWQVFAPVPADYTVFVHVLDADGQLVAQADGPPLEGDWPTSDWLPERPVRDPHTFVVSAPGSYVIQVGLYDPGTVERLIAYRADGSEWPDRAITLAAVRVR